MPTGSCFKLSIADQPTTGGCTMSQATMSATTNGVDVERMGGTVQAIQQNPELADFTFAPRITGSRRAQPLAIKSFYGAILTINVDGQSEAGLRRESRWKARSQQATSEWYRLVSAYPWPIEQHA
jgi:hypothetical protein